jgi:hypothetical protein
MREAIRRQFPSASEQQVRDMIHQRIALGRRLDDIPLPATENAA